MLPLVEGFIWLLFWCEKACYLYKLQHCDICSCGEFLKEVGRTIYAIKLVLISCILGLKLAIFEVRKNRGLGDLFVCFGGMQCYMFNKTRMKKLVVPSIR